MSETTSTTKHHSVLRPEDLRANGVDSLLCKVLSNLNEDITTAEAAGNSQLAESLLMDVNIILELAAGGNMDKAIIELECVINEEIKKEIHRLQRAIKIFECTRQYGKAAQTKRQLWTVLDKAWEERQRRVRPVRSPQHEEGTNK